MRGEFAKLASPGSSDPYSFDFSLPAAYRVPREAHIELVARNPRANR